MTRITAFCVVNSDYIDPAIIALRSFLKYNRVHTIIYAERGTNLRRLRMATEGHGVVIRERDFPELPVHDTLGDKYFSLFCSREALPAYAMRLKALDELRKDYDIILNFDLDTLFFNSVTPLLSRVSDSAIYGVSERRNRDRWIKSLGVKDIAPLSPYLNTGLVIYGAKALQSVDDLMSDYESFLEQNSQHIYCPEQDYINYKFHDYMHEIPAHYNLMFTDVNYRQTPPVMVHFLGRDKPWSGHVTDMQTSAYFRRYAVECQRCEHIISDDFLKKVRATSQLI